MSIMRLIRDPERDHDRRGPLQGPRPPQAVRRSDAGGARIRDRDDLPGPDDLPESRLSRGLADRRASARARADVEGAGAPPRGRVARCGGHPAPRRARRRLSAPVLGRHAPARDDRDGALLQSRPPDRRRADDRTGRHDPGADPCPAAQAATRLRLRDHPDHARHGRRRGHRRPRVRHVRGPCRRGRPRARVVRRRAAPVHVGAARLDSAHRQAEAASPDGHPGPAALAAVAAGGLLLRPPLPARVPGLLRAAAARGARRPGTSTAASCRCPRSARREATIHPELAS